MPRPTHFKVKLPLISGHLQWTDTFAWSWGCPFMTGTTVHYTHSHVDTNTGRHPITEKSSSVYTDIAKCSLQRQTIIYHPRPNWQKPSGTSLIVLHQYELRFRSSIIATHRECVTTGKESISGTCWKGQRLLHGIPLSVERRWITRMVHVLHSCHVTKTCKHCFLFDSQRRN